MRSPSARDGLRGESLPLAFSFRFAALRATVRTNDAPFRARFWELFQDCFDATHAGSHDGASSDLEVTSLDDETVFARIPRHEGANASARLAKIFPELDLVASTCLPTPGCNFLARRSAPELPVVGSHADGLLLSRSAPWQILIAHYFIDHLMRLQPQWGFFHAATLAMGEAGVFLGGPKGAGKSTLSLALAGRGHGFLGDEIGAIHVGSGEIAPFPRAVSIRPGPQALAVREYLERHRCTPHRLADGTERFRVPVSHIFPDASPRPAHLTHAFFLEGFSRQPRVERFEFEARDLHLLGPLHGSLGTGIAARRVIQFLNLFGGAQCYRLYPGGDPERTSDLIEQIVEGKWDTACRNVPSASAPSAGSKSG